MLFTSKTPLRVSFFGGGTDYPAYFDRHPGAVLGMGIDKYVYVVATRLNGFQPYQYRLSYSKLEHTDTREELSHPVVREALKHYDLEGPIDISVVADLPARSGLGSSSSFAVGLINLIHAMKDENISKIDLARSAIHLERDILKENVGIQDQLHASFGGLNRYEFTGNQIRICPLLVSTESMRILNESLVLIFTGQSRFASQVVEKQVEATKAKTIDKELGHLLKLVDDAVSIFEGDKPDQLASELGAMMHEGWMTKRSLSENVSNPEIDALYELACANGAIGGKLCGAGGGGFLLMVVPPERKNGLIEAVAPHPVIPVQADLNGSTVTR